jgi:general secretion pathway protein N
MTPSRRITILLSSIAASLAGLGAAQMLGLGDGYRLLPASERGVEASALSALDRSVFKLPSWGDYAGVLAHPVFNETREPTPVDAVVAEDGAGAEPTAQPINVTLTSILITPKVKIAIVRDNNTGLSSVVKVGSALEGEQSGWKLVEVRPRGAVFEGQGLGRQDLELDVNTAAAAAGAPLPPGMAAPAPPALATTPPEQAPDGNNQVRAEEIRKRIEERRKQLREEAERMRSQEKTQ